MDGRRHSLAEFLVPALVWLLSAIHRHYLNVEAELALGDDGLRLRPRAQALSAQPIVLPARDFNLVLPGSAREELDPEDRL